MRKNNLLGVILILVVSTMILSGCTKYTGPIEQEPTEPTEPTEPEEPEPQPHVNLEEHEYTYYSEEGNLFFSSYSISSALTMTYEGSNGLTAEEMKGVLHLPDDKKKLRSGFAEINNRLNIEDKPYQLSVANALWAQQDYPFKQDYFDLVDENYGGKVTNLNFKEDTENSRVTINNWVEDKTNDRIKDLIPRGVLSPETRLVLTNAIYFKANWTYQFDEQNTYEDEFTLSSGDTITTETMHQTKYYNYGETDDLQTLEMNYLGNDLSMIIILPKEDLADVEDSLNIENLKSWKRDMKIEKVVVSLPKFKFETKYYMANDLKEMGMPTAFNPLLADFTNMWTRQNDENLYISEVIQQTFVEVQEGGTEAAAATAVVMLGASAPIQEEPPKIFKADHPFIFIIQEKASGNILFMGRMSNPE